jgi:hypothetical protein
MVVIGSSEAPKIHACRHSYDIISASGSDCARQT